MLSRIYRRISFVSRVAALLPESECKGKANFGTDKLFQVFFSRKINFFRSHISLVLIFNDLQKQEKSAFSESFITAAPKVTKIIFNASKKNAQQPSFFTKQPQHYPLKNRKSSVLVHKNRGILVFRHLLSLLGEQLLQFMRIKIQGKLAVARHRDTACLLGNNDCNGIGNLGHTHCRAMT